MAIRYKAGAIVVGAMGYAATCAMTLAHSLAAPTGSDQLGEHLPLLLTVGGGVLALWSGIKQVLAMYKAGIEEVRSIVREELAKHTEREEQVDSGVHRSIADLVRRLDAIESSFEKLIGPVGHTNPGLKSHQ